MTRLLIALSFLLTGCASTNDYVYKLYPGPVLDDSELATIRLDDGVYQMKIDGMTFHRGDYTTAKVKPGEHEIDFTAMFGVSVLVNSNGWDAAGTSEIVNLEAGRTYSAQSDRTTGHGYQMFVWIEDVDTGEVVAGSRMP